jgi:4-hydroxy-4-methyl-2-oxoglutarate aldolase
MRRRSAEVTVTRDHVVFADDDGVIFLRASEVDGVLAAAEEIFGRERAQAERVRNGVTLAEQFHFDAFIAARNRDPRLTFRAHLRRIAGEIEE